MPESDDIYGLEPEQPRAARPAAPPPAIARQPCRKCGYDLSGITAPRCPECGTPNSVRPPASARRKGLRDRPALFAGILAVLGFLTAVCISAGVSEGKSFGFLFLAYALGYGAFLLISCGMYFGCAMSWIGWSYTIPTSMLQSAAAFSLTFAASALMGLAGIPFFPLVIGFLILVGLLIELVDLEVQDAMIVALVVVIARLILFFSILGWVMDTMNG